MGAHDAYGKEILRRAAGSGDGTTCAGRAVRLDDGSAITVDGFLKGSVAGEIESRTAKQVRGAILDLWLHGAPKKLLILIPAHHPPMMEAQARAVMGRLLPAGSFEVVSLVGTGASPRPELDVPRVRAALDRLLPRGSGRVTAKAEKGARPRPQRREGRPNMSDVPFEMIWERIKAHEGEEFLTTTGRPFTYVIERGDRVRPIPEQGPTSVTIPKRDFERVRKMSPVEGPGVLNRLVMGPSYVWAILSDPRISRDR